MYCISYFHKREASTVYLSLYPNMDPPIFYLYQGMTGCVVAAAITHGRNKNYYQPIGYPETGPKPEKRIFQL